MEGKLRRSRPAFTGLILLGAIALLFGLQEMLIPGSLSAGQVLLISRQASALGIIALGQALVILSGGIDLSVGSMVLLTNVFAIAWMRGSDLNFARVLAAAAVFLPPAMRRRPGSTPQIE